MADFQRTRQCAEWVSQGAVDGIHIALYHALTGCPRSTFGHELRCIGEQDSRLLARWPMWLCAPEEWDHDLIGICGRIV
jgi:hypothetical protein